MEKKFESTYHYEDNQAKREWRCICVETIKTKFPNGIPKGQIVVILGGEWADRNGKLKPDSEVDKLLSAKTVSGEPLMVASQIVNVDCNKNLIKQVSKNRLGVRNIYAPLKHSLVEGDKCIIPRGQKMAGLWWAVDKLRKEGKIIAVVNADFMATHIRNALPLAGIMEAFGDQKEDALIFSNHNSKVRNSKKPNEIGGSDDVLADLFNQESHPEFYSQYRASKFNKGIWNEVRKPYEYGWPTPMHTIFMERKYNKGVCDRFNLSVDNLDQAVELLRKGWKVTEIAREWKIEVQQLYLALRNSGRPTKIARKVTAWKRSGEKNPVMVKAGKKAYATRLKNQAKK